MPLLAPVAIACLFQCTAWFTGRASDHAAGKTWPASTSSASRAAKRCIGNPCNTATTTGVKTQRGETTGRSKSHHHVVETALDPRDEQPARRLDAVTPDPGTHESGAQNVSPASIIQDDSGAKARASRKRGDSVAREFVWRTQLCPWARLSPRRTLSPPPATPRTSPPSPLRTRALAAPPSPRHAPRRPGGRAARHHSTPRACRPKPAQPVRRPRTGVSTQIAAGTALSQGGAGQGGWAHVLPERAVSISTACSRSRGFSRMRPSSDTTCMPFAEPTRSGLTGEFSTTRSRAVSPCRRR